MNQTVGPVQRGKVYVFVLRALGSAGRWWPFLLVGAVAFLGWEELRRIDLNQVRHSLHSLSGPWLLVASWGLHLALAPIFVVAILGLLAVLLGRLGGTARAPQWMRGGIAAWATLFGVALLDWILAACVFVGVVLSTGQPADWHDIVK